MLLPKASASALDEPAAPLVPQPASRRPIVKPLFAESYRLQITMSRETHDKLRKAQALMRHRVPNGDPAEIFERALDALLRKSRRRSARMSSAHNAYEAGRDFGLFVKEDRPGYDARPV